MPEKTSLGTDQIEVIIVEFIRNELVGDPSLIVDVEDNLLTSGLVDSVGIVRLIAHLNQQLDVIVPQKDLIPQHFRTIRIMSNYMHGLLED